MVLELPATLILASWVFRSRLGRREWACVIVMAAALASMLFTLSPSAGQTSRVHWYAWLTAIGVNGQSCIAAKRFIVHDAVYDELERLFTGQMSAKTVGDPMAEGTDVGPLASEQQREDVEHLVADAAAKGAKVLCGGAAPEGLGFYYPPTVLAGITPEMRVHREEVFGPVATLYRVPDLDTAIGLANDTEFGLGANAWTNDQAERRRFIRDLAAGMVFINGNVTSYPQLPFGGVKSSGHGRELSCQGIREFCNIKSVWVG